MPAVHFNSLRLGQRKQDFGTRQQDQHYGFRYAPNSQKKVRGAMNWIVIAGVVTALSVGGVASAQSPGSDPRVFNELSGEMLECSVYFTISSNCIEGQPDPDAPDLVKSYRKLAKDIGVLAIQIGRSVGVTDDAVRARMKLNGDRMTTSINNNCVNISVLLERYSKFCAQLIKNPDDRLRELSAGQMCGGTYQCK